MWCQRQGPTEILYMDGEGALSNDVAKASLRRLGATLRVRAPGQHANYIEARNAEESPPKVTVYAQPWRWSD